MNDSDMSKVPYDYSVLFVEDELLITLYYEKELKRRFRHVYSAENGKEGLELFNKYRPDIVVTDLLMPGMDGLEMIEHIRNTDPDCSVFIVTALSEEHYLDQALKFGIKGFLTKPIKDHELFSLLEKTAKELKPNEKPVEQMILTERRRSDSALKESETRFRELFNNMSSGVAVYKAVKNGTDFLFQDINKAGERIGNTKRDMIIGKSVVDVYPSIKEFGLFDVFQRVWSTGKPEKHPVSYYKDARISQWVENYVYKLPSGEIVAVYDDISDRKKVEEEIVKFKFISNNSSDAHFLIDKNARFVYVNKTACKILGYKEDELLRLRVPDIDIAYDSVKFQESFHLPLNAERDPVECVNKRKDGTVFPSEISSTALKIDGKPFLFTALRDITKRKIAEEKMKSSLKEKEMLLKEIHHRVKNNLQIICSLFNLQKGLIKDSEAAEMVNECQNRIRAIALVHDKLYKSESLSSININDYMSDLIGDLFSFYEVDPAVIAFTSHIEDILLDINMAIPCGLIVNELVSNSLQYAFPGGQKGDITVSLRQIEKDELVFEISDNGIGMPAEDNTKNTESLGLQIVSGLVLQLHGTMECERSNGTSYKIQFRAV